MAPIAVHHMEAPVFHRRLNSDDDLDDPGSSCWHWKPCIPAAAPPEGNNIAGRTGTPAHISIATPRGNSSEAYRSHATDAQVAWLSNADCFACGSGNYPPTRFAPSSGCMNTHNVSYMKDCWSNRGPMEDNYLEYSHRACWDGSSSRTQDTAASSSTRDGHVGGLDCSWSTQYADASVDRRFPKTNNKIPGAPLEDLRLDDMGMRGMTHRKSAREDCCVVGGQPCRTCKISRLCMDTEDDEALTFNNDHMLYKNHF